MGHFHQAKCVRALDEYGYPSSNWDFKAKSPVQLSDAIQILYYRGPEGLRRVVENFEKQEQGEQCPDRLRNVQIDEEPPVPTMPQEVKLSPQEANARLDAITSILKAHIGDTTKSSTESNNAPVNVIVLTDAVREIAKLVPYTDRFSDFDGAREILAFCGHYIAASPSQVMPRLIGSLAFSASRIRKHIRVQELIDSISMCVREQGRSGRHWKWKPKDIASVAYSYGQLGKAPLDVLQIIGDSTVPKVASFSDKGISNVLFAFTKLGFVHEPLLRELPRKWRDNISTASPQAVTTVVNAYRNSGVRQEEEIKMFLAELLAESVPKLENFKPMELINLFWGMARTNQGDESFLRVMIQHALDRLHEFNRQDLCLLLHGIASMRLKPGTSRLLISVADTLLPHCHQLTSQQTSMVIYSLGRLRIVHPSLMQEITNHASSIHEQFTTQGLANVAWGLAQLGWRKESLMHLLANQASQKAKLMAPREVAMFSDSVAKLQIRADFLMHNFALEGSLRVALFSMQDLGILCYSLALSGNTRRLNILFDAIAFSLDSRIREVRTNDAINLLWAFSIGMYFDETAMRQLLQQIDSEVLRSPEVTKSALFRLQTVLLVLEHLTPFPQLLRLLNKSVRDLALGALNKVAQSEVISASGETSVLDDEHIASEPKVESYRLTSNISIIEGTPRTDALPESLLTLQACRSKRLRRQIVNALDCVLLRKPNTQWQACLQTFERRKRADEANCERHTTFTSDSFDQLEGHTDPKLLAPKDSLKEKKFVESYQTDLGLVADFAIPEDKIAIIAEGSENFRPLHKSAKSSVSRYFKSLWKDPKKYTTSPVAPSSWRTIGEGHFEMPASGVLFPGVDYDCKHSSSGSASPPMNGASDLFALGFQAGSELDEYIRLLPVLLTHHLLLESKGWTVIRVPFYRWQAQKIFDVAVHRLVNEDENMRPPQAMSGHFFSNPLPSTICRDPFPSQVYYLQRQLRAAYGEFEAQIVPCTI